MSPSPAQLTRQRIVHTFIGISPRPLKTIANVLHSGSQNPQHQPACNGSPSPSSGPETSLVFRPASGAAGCPARCEGKPSKRRRILEPVSYRQDPPRTQKSYASGPKIDDVHTQGGSYDEANPRTSARLLHSASGMSFGLLGKILVSFHIKE